MDMETAHSTQDLTLNSPSRSPEVVSIIGVKYYNLHSSQELKWSVLR